MNDTPYRLAYEASVRAIEDQARVLESLRSRAGTIFAAAALVTTFLGSDIVGGPNVVGDFEALSLDGIVVAAFLVSGVLTLIMLWPLAFRFSLSAGAMIEVLDGRTEERPVDSVEAYRELALQLEGLYDSNSRGIRGLLWCFRGAILCLVAEVAAWVTLYWRIDGG
jgi:hypothetical protein